MSLADIAMGKLPTPQQQPQPMPNALAQAAMPQQQAPQLPPQGMPPTPQPAQPAQPQQTQPPAQPQSGKPFNGDITVGDRKVHVTNGLVDGSTDTKKVFVAADGGVVFNEQGQILGSLDANHVLQKPTPELIAKLKSSGLTQEAAGAAPNA